MARSRWWCQRMTTPQAEGKKSGWACRRCASLLSKSRFILNAMKSETVLPSHFTASDPNGLLGSLLNHAPETVKDSMTLIILLGLIALMAAAFWVLLSSLKRPNHRPRNKGWRGPALHSSRPDYSQRRNLRDPKDQLDAVSMIGFRKIPLMNKTEYRVYRMLQDILADIREGYLIMCQPSMGEIIRPENHEGTQEQRNEAYASINSKRLDFALFDRRGLIAVAIEVQGSGHHINRKAFIRDAVKREALRRAGVPMLEVLPNWSKSELSAHLLTALNGVIAAQSQVTRLNRVHG